MLVAIRWLAEKFRQRSEVLSGAIAVRSSASFPLAIPFFLSPECNFREAPKRIHTSRFLCLRNQRDLSVPTSSRLGTCL